MNMKSLMPKWSWEICKMFLYMSFPVICFHYFNSPQIFEEAVTKQKLESYFANPKERQEKFEDMLRQLHAERELKTLQEMQNANKNRSS